MVYFLNAIKDSAFVLNINNEDICVETKNF